MPDEPKRVSSANEPPSASDRIRWQNEHAAWIKDVNQWQSEHQQLLSELESLRQRCEERTTALRAHAYTIFQHKAAIEHAEVTAAQPATPGAERAPSADLCADLAAQHARTRAVHRRFAARHDAIMNQLQALAREIDQFSLEPIIAI